MEEEIGVPRCPKCGGKTITVKLKRAILQFTPDGASEIDYVVAPDMICSCERCLYRGKYIEFIR